MQVTLFSSKHTKTLIVNCINENISVVLFIFQFLISQSIFFVTLVIQLKEVRGIISFFSLLAFASRPSKAKLGRFKYTGSHNEYHLWTKIILKII